MRTVVYGNSEKVLRKFCPDHSSAVKFVLGMRNDPESKFYRLRYRNGFSWQQGDVFIRIES